MRAKQLNKTCLDSLPGLKLIIAQRVRKSTPAGYAGVNIWPAWEENFYYSMPVSQFLNGALLEVTFMRQCAKSLPLRHVYEYAVALSCMRKVCLCYS